MIKSLTWNHAGRVRLITFGRALDVEPHGYNPAVKIPRDRLDNVFDYLDKEMTFQGTASTVSGAAGAWILHEVLPKQMHEIRYETWLLRLAALLLLLAAGLFLFERGELSRLYGNLARQTALDDSIESSELDLMVRSATDKRVITEWWEYYFARACLALGAFLNVLVSSQILAVFNH